MSEIVLGALEFDSVATGIKALDAMVKKAPIIVMKAATIAAGKYLILIKGDVASVEYALREGKEERKDKLIDELFLPNLHKGVIPALEGVVEPENWDSVGIIESLSLLSGIQAADIAAKTENITINEIKMSVELGGRSYIKIMGEYFAVLEAANTAVEWLKLKNLYYSSEIIPRPHPEIKPFYFNKVK